MRNHHRFLMLTTAVGLGLLVGQSTIGASSDSARDRKVQRAVEQSRVEEIKRHDLNLNNLRWVFDDTRPSPGFDRSIITDGVPTHVRASSSAVPPPPSPGIPIGYSTYDYQGNNSYGRHVARMPGADIVHFIWMAWDRIPTSVDDNDRYVAYNSFTISGDSLNQGIGGDFVGLGTLARAGYSTGDVFDDNTFQVVMHQRPDVSLPYGPWRLNFTTPGSSAHVDDELTGYGSGGCPEVLWPSVATSRDGDRTVHVLAHSNVNDCPVDLLWYWRHNGTTWTGPVILDSTPQINYVLADDPTGDKVAVVVNVSNYVTMNGINNVAYYESTTDGAGWISGSEPKIKNVITNYNTDAGPGAWLHLTTAYDHAGILHIVFDEQEDANDNAKTAIKHWNSQRQTVKTVALGYWETPLLTGVYNLNLAKITMGIGDGSTLCQGGAESNEDYLYVLYTQFGGPTPEEQADHSLEGYYNGELYLTASATRGSTWSEPTNLTNTKTPNCNPGRDSIGGFPERPDSVCRSEHWATIGLAVSDIDIFFISDLDAGGIPQGEGTWQMNPVHYYRIPGGTTDAQYLCPLIAPNFEASLTSDPACEYHASQAGSHIETLTIMNLGNGPLSGTITVTDFPGSPVLDVSGSPVFSIAGGGADDIRTVTMSANGAPEGLYSGLISIAHDDASEPSPKEFPIDFFVFNEFFCPIFEVLKTGVASPGSLAMAVTNDGRFGDGNPMHGLWRHKDSSSSVDAGTFLIAHGTQGPDTTVFLHYGTRASNGQRGFRALSDLYVDTFAYSTGNGCAGAIANFVTADSVVGVEVEWVFPQDYDLDEFVHAYVRVYRHNISLPITDLAIGILVDMDAIPAGRLGSIQLAATNEPGSDGTRNLVWTRGVDTAGHFITGQNTATRFRGGIVVPGGFEGALVGNYVSDIAPGGGPTDGYLYYQLQNLQGIDLYSVADTDLYVMIALDKGRSIAFAETLEYSFAFVSDTISEASLKATVDGYLAIMANLENCFGEHPSCPCWADPQCDGVRSNVQDVVGTINVAFRGTAAVIDPGCPLQRTDVNADSITNVGDVVRVVNVAFRGASVASQYVFPF